MELFDRIVMYEEILRYKLTTPLYALIYAF